jgi:membrane fusion protein, multidrug efflux system
MSGSRNLVTPISIAIAVICAGWAIYVTKRADAPSSAFGPGSGAPSGREAPGRPPGGRPASSNSPGPATAGGPPGGAPRAPTLVATVESRLERIANQVEAIGTARANESIDVTAKVSNLVTAIRFADGQRVARGQLLVELDSAAVRADLAVAQAALTESESQFNRSRELLATQLVSKSQFEQIEATLKANRARVAAAQARREDTVIRAPFAGRVGLRRVSVGSLVNPGTVITTLDDTSKIKLDFAVPENFLATLRPGLALSARAPAFPARSFEGAVASIDSRVDERTRAVTVRALLPNPDGLLRPGMFLNVRLAKDEREAITIPEEALVPETDKQFVYVVSGGNAAKREVSIGRRAPGTVEIVTGLQVGERVVVEGTQSVRDGGAVRDMSAAPGADSRASQPAAASAASNPPRS